MITLLCIYLLSFLSPCSNNKNANDDLIVNTEVICVGFPFLVEDKYFCIQISVKNTSDSLKTFWVYSCTWQDSFITDQEDIELCKKECRANYPIDINLHKNDSIVFNCIIKVASTAFKHETFKIGLVSMNETEVQKMFIVEGAGAKTIDEAQKSLRKYLLTFKVYWSNPISFHISPRGFDFKKWRS